jgi:hypothetical protein
MKPRAFHLLAMFAVFGAIYFTMVACGEGGDDTETGPLVTDELPSTAQGGSVPENATIIFEGREYQAVAVTLNETITDETADFERIGVVEEASVPLEGEVAVYRRADDEDAIYTGALTPSEGGVSGANQNVRYRWVPAGIVAPTEGAGGGTPDADQYDPAER